MAQTTGIWLLKTKDGEKYAFYHDHEEEISPLERIEDFDRGNCWSIDLVPENEKYEKDPEDDSFYLIPKKDIVEVWFEKYTEKNRPRKLKTHTIDEIINKIGF